jgi:DsbC/DsbD-like thiol-disulfide interchange protein
MKLMLTLLSCLLAAAFAGVTPAAASSSDWHTSQGGKVRLVTTGNADAAGHIKGALEISLDPGWKTYWRDPGDSGVPPQMDISPSTNIKSVTLAFPAPRHHDDGYGVWAGYDHSVSIPVTFTQARPGTQTMIQADVFLGICEMICIPLQARLAVAPAKDPGNETDAELVKAAFAALPDPERPGFGIKVLPGDHETLNVEAMAPGDPASVDFFVAGEGDYMFGPPKRSEKDGKITFSVQILDRPTTAPGDGGLHYTLTGSEGAVAGLLPYP